MIPTSSVAGVVTDASVLVAICAKETNTYSIALAQMRQYVQAGCLIYAPGVVVAETLYAFCRKSQTGDLTPAQHRRAIRRLRVALAGISPPPNGDFTLAARAEEIRGSYGRSRSADGLYIALAEELALIGPTELVAFDRAMPGHAAATAPTVIVRLLTAAPPAP